MTSSWHLGLAQWQIEDGHPNVAVGDEIVEAVECQIGDWNLVPHAVELAARHIEATRYAVTARLLARPDPYLFDIGGLIVGSHGWPNASFDRRTQVEVGDVIAAEFDLGIDPIGLSHFAPPDVLIDRRWTVRGVRVLEGPWIKSSEGFRLDISRSRWVAITDTKDHPRRGSFILDCELLA